MTYYYILLGIQMSQEELAQVKQDIERLVADVKKLMSADEEVSCTNEDGKMTCHSTCGNHTKAFICLGLTALVAGIAGVIITRKHAA